MRPIQSGWPDPSISRIACFSRKVNGRTLEFVLRQLYLCTFKRHVAGVGTGDVTKPFPPIESCWFQSKPRRHLCRKPLAASGGTALRSACDFADGDLRLRVDGLDQNPSKLFAGIVKQSDGHVTGIPLECEVVVSGVKHSFRSTTIRFPDVV